MNCIVICHANYYLLSNIRNSENTKHIQEFDSDGQKPTQVGKSDKK